MSLKNFLEKRKLFVIYVIIFFIFIIILSNIISGMKKEDVPVIKVEMITVEKDNIVNIENISLIPGNVSYMNRPIRIQAESFPAIAGRVTILKGKESIIGPWEAVKYNGDGKYTFNIGFKDYHPQSNEAMHVSIMIIAKNGDRIGYFVKDIVWK